MATNESSIYNFKINKPQYEPKTPPKHGVRDCVDVSKVKELRERIENEPNITEDERAFLKIAAARHYKFSYDKIADYYACASPEMQRLMEESALVIIDFENAIQNGYVTLNKKVKEILADRVGDDNA